MIIGIDGNEANNVRPDINARVGVNQYAFGILWALYKLDHKNKYQIYLELPPRNDLPPERENWHYQVLGPAKFWTQWKLPIELFLGKRPDVFFTPSHYAPRFSPIPTVVSIMDLGFYRFPEQFKKRDLWQLQSWTEYSVKKAAHILAISESTKKDIVEKYGIRPEKITVTYPGYDKEKFKVKRAKLKVKEIKRKYKIKKDYILYLGTLKPSKNIEGLLEAFGLLIANKSELKRIHANEQIKLVIAGSRGWLYQTIFEKVRQLRLSSRVIFTDFVPDEEVPALLAGARVFVLPSFWEGFGIPVVEAMAVGTPVVVSNVGSLSEVVGEAAVLVDPKSPKSMAEGIQKVISTLPDKYNKLVEAGLSQAKKFSWEKAAKQTLEVLEKVAK